MKSNKDDARLDLASTIRQVLRLRGIGATRSYFEQTALPIDVFRSRVMI